MSLSRPAHVEDLVKIQGRRQQDGGWKIEEPGIKSTVAAVLTKGERAALFEAAAERLRTTAAALRAASPGGSGEAG